jgi:carboxypeptidase T
MTGGLALAGLLLTGSGPRRHITHVQCGVGSEGSTRMAIRVYPRSQTQYDEALAAALDVWSEYPSDAQIDIVVDASAWSEQAAEFDFEVLVANIDAVAAEEHQRLAAPRAARPAPGEWFSDYRDFGSVLDYLELLAVSHPELARIEDVGTSIEGRPLRAIHIGANADAPTFVFNGGQHAREWISVMTTTCIADRLTRGYADDPRVRAILDTTQVVVLPVANPDGYAFSWTNDRYWRKNRRGDHGVDLNRNYPVAFGGRGASDDPNSPVYHGEHAFSEPESMALRDLIRRESPLLHIDFHSYSQLVLYPWGFTTKAAPDSKRLASLAKQYAKVVAATHGEKYTPKSGGALYPAAGTLMDWVYAERDIPALVIELRPRRGSGFVLPPDQIGPTCDENFAAVLDLIERLPRE